MVDPLPMQTETDNVVMLDVEDCAGHNGDQGDDPLLGILVMSKILGITDRRLRQLCELGAPRSSRGFHPLMGCVHWYVKYTRDCAAKVRNYQRDRKLRLQADILEHKLKVLQSRVVNKLEIEAALETRRNELQHLFKRLPAVIAVKLGLPLSVTRELQGILDESRRDFVDDLEVDSLMRRNRSRARRQGIKVGCLDR